MSKPRLERVQEALRQEISRIIHDKLRDPRIGFITITKVDLTKDLRHARVYFSVLGEMRDKNLALKGLNSAKGYIKNLIADKIKLRFMPEVIFKIDDTLEHAREIYDLLGKLKKEKDDSDERGNRGDKEK